MLHQPVRSERLNERIGCGGVFVAFSVLAVLFLALFLEYQRITP